MSKTKRELRRLLAADLSPTFLTGTAEDGGTVDDPVTQLSDTLVDASADGLLDSSYDTSRFKGAWLLLAHDDPLPLEEHPRKTFNPDAGSLTIGRSFANTPVSGETEWEVHPHGLRPFLLNDFIEQTAAEVLADEYVVLVGEVTDGAFEDDGTASWAATTATLTKSSGSRPRTLRVVTTAAGGYALSDAIAVTVDTQWRVYGAVTPAAGVSRLAVLDADTLAELDVVWQGDEDADAAETTRKTVLVGSLTVPDGTTAIALALTNDDDSGDATWHYAGAFPTADDQVVLPAWVDDYQHQLLAVYTMDRQSRLTREGGLSRPENGVIPDWYCPTIPVLRVSRHPDLDAETASVSDTVAATVLLGAKVKAYRRLIEQRSGDSAYYSRRLVTVENDYQNALWSGNPVARFGRQRWET